MAETKDRILEAALRLFARDGYEAVSTSAIAGELGMAKSALYKHFPDKRAIFDSLVELMLERHRRVGEASGLETGAVQTAAQAYASADSASMADLGEALFRYWTLDESAVAFRHLLSIERFRDSRVEQVYDELFVGGKLRYHARLFASMMEAGAFEVRDAVSAALEFWSPIALLMDAVDGGMNEDEAIAMVRAHVLAFAQKHVRG